MSFYIKLGNTTENAMSVNKTYTEVTPSGGVEISPTSTIDQLRPVFIIAYNQAYININYCEAPFLGRKYFAKVNYDNGQRMTIECEVDYLSSFDLSECDMTAVRNGGIGAPTKIQDNKYPVIPNEETIDQVPVSNSQFTANGSGCYVLQVIGGATSGS